jgi:ATP-dependent DNA helicase RecG
VKAIYSDEEIRALLQRAEGQFLEFKSLWDQQPPTRKALPRRKVRDMIAECVAAFANADGGTLILGAEDDGTPSGHRFQRMPSTISSRCRKGGCAPRCA